MEFSKEELKDIVLSSYELLVKIPPPEQKSNGKFEIQSRSKLKNLPESLREMEDASAGITHFVKTASYFLPRAEKGGRDEIIMQPFLDLLLNKVIGIQSREKDAKRARENIKYLLGYTNWNVDAVCTIFTASKDDLEIKRRLQTMLGAELNIIGAEQSIEKLVSEILKWKQSAVEARQYGRR
jgi:hypothetical protein